MVGLDTGEEQKSEESGGEIVVRIYTTCAQISVL